MKRYDAVVVGGGPAGSATAWRLGAAGASVLVVDRASFPRDKPCGGGMTMRAVHHCPVDPSPVVEEEVDVLELRFRYGAAVERHARRPLIRMTQRRRLDAFLLDAARERGVEVREKARVELDPPSHSLSVGGERVRFDALVGADGANGVTARAFALGDGIAHGVAFEGNVRYGDVSRERYARRAVIELGDIRGGYGWVFAKGDHVNVGVGAWESEGPRIRDHLRRVCDAHGIDVAKLEHVRGHRLPMRRPGTRIAGERVLLVGDAAGLIDPVSGDGMYECFVSARLASNAVLDLLAGRARTLRPYETAVDTALMPLHNASWKLKRAFDRWPRASWRLASAGVTWRSVERVLQGELAHPGEQSGLARVPLKALAVLGR